MAKKKNTWDAFAFLYITLEQIAIFLREGLFFETLASTFGNTESGWGFVALKSLKMPTSVFLLNYLRTIKLKCLHSFIRIKTAVKSYANDLTLIAATQIALL